MRIQRLGERTPPSFYWQLKLDGLKSLVVIAAVILLVLNTQTANSTTILICNYSGGIVEDRQEFSGAHTTNYKLFRVDESNMIHVQPYDGPTSVNVSPREWRRERDNFAESDRKIGVDVGREITLESGQKIKPAYYSIRFPDSFKFFLEHKEQDAKRKNYLLEDFIRAEQSSSKSGLRLKGPCFSSMVKMLENPKTARTFGIWDFRGHSDREWQEFSDYLLKKGYIKNPLNLKLVYNLASPQFARFDDQGKEIKLEQKILRRKEGLLEEITRHLRDVELGDEDMRLNADGDSQGRSHFLIVEETDKDTLDFLQNKFGELARSKNFPIKFGIVDARSDSQIRASGRTRFSVVTSGGLLRRHKSLEEFSEIMPEFVSAKAGCSELFAN